MPILATNNSSPRELVPAGNFIARCYKMIHIGTVIENIEGKSVTLEKVRIGWELPLERKVFDTAKGEEPYVIDQEYTLSMSEKANLRKMLTSWRGKAFSEEEAKSFDIMKLLGVPCMLNIVHKASKSDATKVYEQIASVSSMPKGIECPVAHNRNLVFEWANPNWDVFDSLPDFIKNKIKSSAQYIAFTQKNSSTASPDTFNNVPGSNGNASTIDDLPF